MTAYSQTVGIGDMNSSVLVQQRQLARQEFLRQSAWMVGVIAVLTVLVLLLSNAYWIKTLISAFTLSIAVAGVALLYGQLGLISLCQYALLGLGGWVGLRLAHTGAVPFELSVLGAGAAAAVFSMVVGLPALRMRGLYLALVTLMIAGGFAVVVSATGFPDGGAGWLGRMVGSERQMMTRPLVASSDEAYFVYVMVWLCLVLLLVQWHRMSKPGRAWALIRRGEAVASAAGVNIVGYQTWAFALSGWCAGVSGALLAGGVGQLDGRAFGASESVMLFALTVVGGAYHWLGALITGLLLRAFPALLQDFDVNAYLAMMVFGVALLHALMTAPRGIAGQILRK